MPERVAVVGGGPAGVAAALAASSAGKRVCLLDEGFRPGGQIWRHRSGQAPPEALRRLAELEAAPVEVLARASVFDAEERGGRWRLALSQAGQRRVIDAEALVLACGARERLLPFPGWTLPGVLGAGGGQALLKEGLDLQGEPVVVAGTGPLLLPVAASVRKGNGWLQAVLEQAPRARLLGMLPVLATRPAKALQALRLGWRTPYRPGWWVQEALGETRLEAVRMTNGQREEVVPCRWLFCGFGLVPNLELGRLLGCAGTASALWVDEAQRSSVTGVFAAGEVCGVAGVDAALAEGAIAGLAAAGAWAASAREARRLIQARARGREMARALETIFALRPELRRLPRPDTILCRCEDVPFGAIDPVWGVRETKLCTRAGMGPCQGRVCGPILMQQYGHDLDSVRIPLKAVALSQLIPEEP
jgi:D-hydroxyproline dehydrogenase subunit alpha